MYRANTPATIIKIMKHQPISLCFHGFFLLVTDAFGGENSGLFESKKEFLSRSGGSSTSSIDTRPLLRLLSFMTWLLFSAVIENDRRRLISRIRMSDRKSDLLMCA